MLMKYAVFLLFSCMMLFPCCKQDESPEEVPASYENQPVIAFGSQTYLSVSGVKGKAVIYGRRNISDVTLAEKNQRTLLSSTGLSPSKDIACKTLSSSRAAGIDDIVTADMFDVGTSKLPLWLETGYQYVPTYTEKTVTLRAKGTDASGTVQCLVWVWKDNFTTDSSKDDKINASTAKFIADTFASHYAHERSVYGAESPYLLEADGTSVSAIPMEHRSECYTGAFVNIVVFDIDGDFDSSKGLSGTGGYFRNSDYYKVNGDNPNKSNVGKFLYVDAPSCNYVKTGDWSGHKDKDGNSIAAENVISTLFHEFQHMIDFNQKEILSKITPSNWYNEMLSMLAEDMMASQLGTEGSIQKLRFPYFNAYYYRCGPGTYNRSYTVPSYSMAYTFGAWVSRTYGGPELVQKMSRNSSVDMTSMCAAISEQTGKEVHADDLYRDFMYACVFRDSLAQERNLPTLCKDAGNDIVADGFTSTMKAVSLFSPEYSYPSDGRTCIGPQLFSDGTMELPAHAFSLHYIGTAEKDTIYLRFGGRLSDTEELTLFIQDDFTNIIP